MVTYKEIIGALESGAWVKFYTAPELPEVVKLRLGTLAVRLQEAHKNFMESRGRVRDKVLERYPEHKDEPSEVKISRDNLLIEELEPLLSEKSAIKVEPMSYELAKSAFRHLSADQIQQLKWLIDLPEYDEEAISFEETKNEDKAIPIAEGT